MGRYILAQRGELHILNLSKTVQMLSKACDALTKSASHRGELLLVGTRSHATVLVAAAARRARCHYVNRKWLGGMLTNWATTKTRLQRLTELECQEQSGVFQALPKKESAVLRRQLSQLRKYLDGIKYMTGLPDMVIILDPLQDATALQECSKLDIPTICLVDTNCDPELTDMPIPANNESRRAIQCLLRRLVLAVQEGRNYASRSIGAKTPR